MRDESSELATNITYSVENFNIFSPDLRTRTLRYFGLRGLGTDTLRRLDDLDIGDRSIPHNESNPDWSVSHTPSGTRLIDNGDTFQFGTSVSEMHMGGRILYHASYFIFEAPVPQDDMHFTWSMRGSHWAARDNDFTSAEVARRVRLAICDVTARQGFIDEYFEVRGGRASIPANWSNPGTSFPVPGGHVIRFMIACGSHWDRAVFDDGLSTIRRSTNYTFSAIRLQMASTIEALDLSEFMPTATPVQ